MEALYTANVLVKRRSDRLCQLADETQLSACMLDSGKIFICHFQPRPFIIPNHVNDSPTGAVVVKLNAIDATFDEISSVRVPPGFICTESVCNVAKYIDDVLDFNLKEGATSHDLFEVFRIICGTHNG